MKKIYSLLAGAILASALFVVLPKVSNAAYPAGYVVDGFVESMDNQNLKGWVYQNDQPTLLHFCFEEVVSGSEGERICYSATNAQQSNKISYWDQRADVKAYLNAKYKANLPFTKPQSFQITLKYIPLGTWKLAYVSTDGLAPKDLAIGIPNVNFTSTNPLPYEEGYIDSTFGGIKGWVYSSEVYAVDYAPRIEIAMKKVDGSEKKVFVLPRGKQIEGYMMRSERQDVTSFLRNERGQPYSWFTGANTKRNFTGFTFNHNSAHDDPTRPLTSGQWEIEYIKADDFFVPYGNTNPSSIVTVD